MAKKCKIREAADILGLSEHALRKKVKEGEIPFLTVGNRLILDVDLVESVLRETALENMEKNSVKTKGQRIRRVAL